MIALLLDEMLSPRIAEQLRRAGVDARGVSESPARRGLSDVDVLELSAAEGRVLVTENIADFVALARGWADQGRRHLGILLVSGKAFPQDHARAGRLATALLVRVQEERWPGVGIVDFL